MNLESSKKLSVLYHDKTGDKGIGMKGAPGLKGDQGMKGDMGKTLRLDIYRSTLYIKSV
jgi:hypothetical protein